MSEKLTQRQRDVLAVIVAYRQINGIMPTKRDIAKCMGMQINAVYGHLDLMQKKGVLDFDFGMARSIRLCGEHHDYRNGRSA